MNNTDNTLNIAQDLLSYCLRLGASAADILAVSGQSLSAQYRLGRIENVERNEQADLGLRLFVGQSQACVSTSDWSWPALQQLAARAYAMAQACPPDPHAGLASEGTAYKPDTLDLYDSFIPTLDWLQQQSLAAEESGRAVAGISNSEGASASYSQQHSLYLASNGFSGTTRQSHFSLQISLLAGAGTAMERDYDYSTATHAADMIEAAQLGQQTADATLRRLHPQKIATCTAPVIFAPRTARSLLSHFLSAINGSNIARGSSFLRQHMQQKIFNSAINIIDSPLRQRGQRSRPFDAEGIAGKALHLVQNGALNSWLLDLRTARQLGLSSTGHAQRGTASAPNPSASNVWLSGGTATPEQLMQDLGQGLYVTDLMGHGIDMLTGDYSRGARGFWFEQGKISYPVNEITIAGNLLEMFSTLIAANDLSHRYGIDAPTLAVPQMTIAGQ